MASQIITDGTGAQTIASGKVRQGGQTLPVGWAILAAGLLIAAAVFFRVSQAPPTFQPVGAVGSLQTVTLTNGGVYFGRMTSVAHDSVVLSDVYEAITSTNPATKQQVTRLVSRRQADWHGPLDMTIPDDRILFIETIGPGSSVGKAIVGAERSPAVAQPKPPIAATKP